MSHLASFNTTRRLTPLTDLFDQDVDVYSVWNFQKILTEDKLWDSSMSSSSEKPPCDVQLHVGATTCRFTWHWHVKISY